MQDTCYGKNVPGAFSFKRRVMTLPMFLIYGRQAFIPRPTDGKNSGICLSADGESELSNGVCLTLKTSECPRDGRRIFAPRYWSVVE